MALRRRSKKDDATEFKAPLPNPLRRAMAKVAESFDGWRPAREVLTRVRAVPTIFPQIDRATRCGGWPIQRFCVVHGPSGHGKTALTHGLGLSFLMRDHFYANVDAEYTTPEDWLQKLMEEYADHPGFLAKRPKTYEETVDAVRSLLHGLEAEHLDEKSKLHDTSALIVVDSIRKLVPEDFWTKIYKHGAGGKKGSVDGMSGRGAQIKAKMNADWLDELTPTLYHADAGMVVIARESEDTTADANDKMYGNDWKMTGGKALEFDSSLIARVTREGYIREKDSKKDGEKQDLGATFGERHRVTIRKTKVGGKETKATVCYFHTSNGVLIPEGFDRARDILEMALGYGIVELAGSWFKWRNSKWQGKNAAVRQLTARKDALAKLEEDVRARFAPDEPLPTTEE